MARLHRSMYRLSCQLVRPGEVLLVKDLRVMCSWTICWVWNIPEVTVQMYVPSSATRRFRRVRDTLPSSTTRAGSTLAPSRPADTVNQNKQLEAGGFQVKQSDYVADLAVTHHEAPPLPPPQLCSSPGLYDHFLCTAAATQARALLQGACPAA